MNITDSANASNSPFTIQAGRDLLAALQAQDQSISAAGEFKRTLESSNSITDTIEILPITQRLNGDPTSSALFQAHLGALASDRTSVTQVDNALFAEEHTQLQVAGIAAATATGPFANGESSQPDDFWLGFPGTGPLQSSQYPAAAGANGPSGTYGPKVNFQIGTHMDLKG